MLIGHKNHPEVIGTMGQVPDGKIDLIETIDDAKNYERVEDKTRPVIFSAHGVPKSVPQEAESLNMIFVDAT